MTLPTPALQALSDAEIQALFDAHRHMSEDGRLDVDYSDEELWEAWLAEAGPLTAGETRAARRSWDAL